MNENGCDNQKIRSSTDSFFIHFSASVFLTWMIAIIYGFCIADEYKLYFSNKRTDYLILTDSLYSAISSSTSTIYMRMTDYTRNHPLVPIIGISLAILSALAYFFWIRKFQRIHVFLGINYVAIMTVVMMYFIYRVVTNNCEPGTIFCITVFNATVSVILIVLIIYGIVPLVFTTKESIRVISDVIKKTSCVFFCFRYLIIFGIFVYSLTVIVALLSIVTLQSCGPKDILFYIVLLQAVYLINFIHLYGKAIINLLVAFWYETEKKEEIPKTVLFHCIATITRYHAGSVAFGATHVLPFGAAAISCWQKLRKSSSSASFSSWMLMVYLLSHVTEYSLIVTAVNGKNFHQATKEAVEVLTKKSALALSFLVVIDGVFLSAFLMVLLVGAIPSIVWVFISIASVYISLHFFPTGIHQIILSSAFTAMLFLSILMLPFLIVLRPVASAIYFCELKNDEKQTDDHSIGTEVVVFDERL